MLNSIPSLSIAQTPTTFLLHSQRVSLVVLDADGLQLLKRENRSCHFPSCWRFDLAPVSWFSRTSRTQQFGSFGKNQTQKEHRR
jgi:hypothetical protein